MNNKIDFTYLLDVEECETTQTLIYFVKLYLKEKMNIPVVLNPSDVFEEDIKVENGNFNYTFLVNGSYENSFEMEYEYTK